MVADQLLSVSVVLSFCFLIITGSAKETHKFLCVGAIFEIAIFMFRCLHI